ncbi:hypothetical protein CLOM_g18786, partial [Closterium sp. NIES-68]
LQSPRSSLPRHSSSWFLQLPHSTPFSPSAIPSSKAVAATFQNRPISTKRLRLSIDLLDWHRTPRYNLLQCSSTLNPPLSPAAPASAAAEVAAAAAGVTGTLLTRTNRTRSLTYRMTCRRGLSTTQTFAS